MKKSYAAMGISTAVILIAAGCASTKNDDAGQRIAAWENFQNGAIKAKIVKMCNISPLNALARTSTVFYKRTADKVIEYVEVTKGDAKTQTLLSWYNGILKEKRPQSATDPAVVDKINEICFEMSDCNDAEILKDFQKDVKAVEKRKNIIRTWYAGTNRKNSTGALGKEFSEMIPLNSYLDFVEANQALKDENARKSFIAKSKNNAAAWKQIQTGKKVLERRMKAKNIDSEKTIAECRKMLNEIAEVAPKFAMESTQALKIINEKYAPQIMAASQAELPLRAKVFGRTETEEKALRDAVAKREKLQKDLQQELNAANTTINGVNDQITYTGKGLAWVVENYLDIQEVNRSI